LSEPLKIHIFVGNNDFSNESNYKTNHFSNNGLSNTKDLDDFLQIPTPLKAFFPPLTGKINQ